MTSRSEHAKCSRCGRVIPYTDLGAVLDYIVAGDVFDKRCGGQIVIVDVDDEEEEKAE
jgi:hypothetical protein